MTNARRLTMMGLLLCGVLVLAPNSWAQTTPANSRTRSPRPMVSIRGIKIEAIRYTWNLRDYGQIKCSHVMGVGTQDQPGHL